MKKYGVVLLSVLFVLGMVGSAFAIDTKDIPGLESRLKKLEEAKKVDHSGFIKVRYHQSNFLKYNVGQVLPPDKTVAGADSTAQFMEQRARLYISPVFNEYLKGTFGFELDSRWGDAAYVSGMRNAGGGLETDTINIETKSINLTFKLPDTNLSSTIGLHTINDPYNWILLGVADAAGITVTNKFANNVNGLLGYYRFWQPTAVIKSTSSVDFFRAEAALAPAKDLKLGLNLYVLLDNSGRTAGNAVLGDDLTGVRARTTNGFAPLAYNSSTGNETLVGKNLYKMNLFLPGVNFDYKVGNFNLGGFFIYEGGKYTSLTQGISDVTISSYAANLKAGTKVGPFNVQLEGLYVSGDNSDTNPSIGIKGKGFYTPGSYSLAAAWMAKTPMIIFFPELDTSSQDYYLVYDVSNIYEQKPLGIKVLMLAGDTILSKEFKLKSGVGTLWSAKDRKVNGESLMGTEINTGIYYTPVKAKAFSIGLIGAYVFVGDFYKVTSSQATAYNTTKASGLSNITANNDPADLWRITVRAMYSF